MRRALLLLVLACDAALEQCPSSGGVYQTSYERVSGDCPDLESQSVEGSPIGPPLFADCAGETCDARWSWRCTTRPGQPMTWSGSLRWDGATGTGEATLRIADLCESRYVVASRRR